MFFQRILSRGWFPHLQASFSSLLATHPNPRTFPTIPITGKCYGSCSETAIEVFTSALSYKSYSSKSHRALHHTPLFSYLVFSSMNAFPAGTRVFWWTSEGDVQYAIVQSSSRLTDGTQILVLKLEGKDKIATLPAAGVTKVSQWTSDSRSLFQWTSRI